MITMIEIEWFTDACFRALGVLLILGIGIVIGAAWAWFRLSVEDE